VLRELDVRGNEAVLGTRVTTARACSMTVVQGRSRDEVPAHQLLEEMGA
jgi:hypothetical protein